MLSALEESDHKRASSPDRPGTPVVRFPLAAALDHADDDLDGQPRMIRSAITDRIQPVPQVLSPRPGILLFTHLDCAPEAPRARMIAGFNAVCLRPVGRSASPAD
jgi:hypothetical protein